MNTKGKVPFVVVLHGCTGLSPETSNWAYSMVDKFNAEGYGVVVLDSFTSRGVEMTCGDADLHWARRRAEDCFSALKYLIDKALAIQDQIYVYGKSNGATATMVALTTKYNTHGYKFAAGFALQPSCISISLKHGDFYNPVIAFIAEKDQANDPKHCYEMMKKKRRVPLEAVVWKDAHHSYEEKRKPTIFNGWRLEYQEKAAEGTIDRTLGAIKDGQYTASLTYQ